MQLSLNTGLSRCLTGLATSRVLLAWLGISQSSAKFSLAPISFWGSAWLDLVLEVAWQLGQDVLCLPSWNNLHISKRSHWRVTQSLYLVCSQNRIHTESLQESIYLLSAHLTEPFWLGRALLAWQSQWILCSPDELNNNTSESVYLNAPFTGHAKPVSLQLIQLWIYQSPPPAFLTELIESLLSWWAN